MITERVKLIKQGYPPYIVFFTALFVRVYCILEITYSKPFYQTLFADAKIYDKWGQDIAAGNIIGSGVFFQDPLYPYFLGLIYSLFGHNLFIVVLVQGIIGSVTALLVFLIGKRLVNIHVGIIAGMLWSFHPPIIFHEGLLLKEGIAVFLSTLSIYTLIVARGTGNLRHWFLGGLVVALSALTRGNILFVIPFIFLWIIYEYRMDFVNSSLFFLLGLLMLLLPIAARNKVIGGEFVLTTYAAGSNFYLGNNVTSRGSYTPTPEFTQMEPTHMREDFAKEAMRLTGKKMSNSEVSKFWFKKGMDFILENPMSYIWLQYQKVELLFNKSEVSDNYSYYYFKRFSTILSYSPASFWLIASLGILGMVLSINKWRELSLLYVFVIFYSMSLVVFFVNTRYRLPTTPALAIFAAQAIYSIWEKLYEKRYRIAAASIVLLVFTGSFVGQEIKWVSTLTDYEVLSHEASDLMEHHNYKAALDKYIKAIKIEPLGYDALVGVGDAYMKIGRPDDAIKAYKEGIANFPLWPLARYQLGMALIDVGRTDEGIEEFRTMTELNPDIFNSYLGLAMAFEKKGMLSDAFRYWEECLKRSSDEDLSKLIRVRLEELRRKGYHVS